MMNRLQLIIHRVERHRMFMPDLIGNRAHRVKVRQTKVVWIALASHKAHQHLPFMRLVKNFKHFSWLFIIICSKLCQPTAFLEFAAELPTIIDWMLTEAIVLGPS